MILTYGNNTLRYNTRWFDYNTLPPVPTITPITIGNQIWSLEYVTPEISGVQSTKQRTLHDKVIHYYSIYELQNITFPDGWRLATKEDMSTLVDYYPMSDVNTCLISVDDGGTDNYGLNLYLTGLYIDNSLIETERAYVATEITTSSGQSATGLRPTVRGISSYIVTAGSTPILYTPFRLIKDILYVNT